MATLRRTDGTTEQVTAEYLVGVDGPASTVRTLLDIRFDGDPIDVSYAIGDAPVTGDVPAEAQYYYCRTGVVALVPVTQSVRWLPKGPIARPDPGFVTQLIATADQAPQTRSLRRGSAADAQTAYRASQSRRYGTGFRTRQTA